MASVIRGKALVVGQAIGEVLVSTEPLSFWGGYDQRTGEIIDRRHPLSGEIAAGRVLAVPFTRGSSTTTAVILEAIRAGTAPAAFLTIGIDAFFALASIVAAEMYAKQVPVVSLLKEDYARLQDGQWVMIHEDGRLELFDSRPEAAEG